MSVNDFNSSMLPLNYISKLNLTKEALQTLRSARFLNEMLELFWKYYVHFFLLRAAIFSIDLSKNIYQ
ncbi:hypothetical protein T06_6473 [Trichinella sp. T6]|nr:hypothetical protein T06_6473 [Trichinella sp. T6]